MTTGSLLAPGSWLGGYRIVDLIGIGGMGVVYHAKQASLKRDVALKVLDHDLADDESFRERFRREGESVARFDHPNIVPIFDSGEVDGQLYLAMRLVKGATLAGRMREGPLTAPETVSILAPIADALDAAHAEGIVHRDVKPQNILLENGSGRPYLADFGVAKDGGEGMTTAGGFIGTYNYAAPEQLAHEPVSAATDVYGLTAVLYQCLTGELPYPRGSEDTATAHVSARPSGLPANHPAADRFDEIFARGMAKAPGERFTTANDLIEAVAGAIESLPPSERDASLATDEANIAGLSAAAGMPRAASSVDPTVSLDASPAYPHSTTLVSHVPPTANLDEAADPADVGRVGRRSGLLVGGGVALALIAALTIILLAGAGGAHAAKRDATARSGPLTVRYPTAWRAGADDTYLTSAISGTPIALHRDGVTLVAGTLATSAVMPAGVPPVLLAELGRPTSSGPATIAGDRGEQYEWSAPADHLIATVLALTTGDVAVVCRGHRGLSDCSALARTVTVRSTDTMPPGPDASLATPVNRDLAAVTATRRGLGALAAPTYSARAQSAKRLAAREREAAAALTGLAAPQRYHDLISGLASALLGEAQALATLANAAGNGALNDYPRDAARVSNVSRSLVTATRRLTQAGVAVRAYKELRLAGPLPTAPPVIPAPPIGGSSAGGQTTTNHGSTSLGTGLVGSNKNN